MVDTDPARGSQALSSGSTAGAPSSLAGTTMVTGCPALSHEGVFHYKTNSANGAGPVIIPISQMRKPGMRGEVTFTDGEQSQDSSPGSQPLHPVNGMKAEQTRVTRAHLSWW